MATRYTEEFRRDAVRFAISSGLTLALAVSSIQSIHERGGRRFHQIWSLTYRY
jgi:transposase-like protein